MSRMPSEARTALMCSVRAQVHAFHFSECPSIQLIIFSPGQRGGKLPFWSWKLVNYKALEASEHLLLVPVFPSLVPRDFPRLKVHFFPFN